MTEYMHCIPVKGDRLLYRPISQPTDFRNLDLRLGHMSYCHVSAY